MNITCYIVDDEFHAIEMLKEHILQTPGLELVGFSENPLIALNEVQELLPDIIFLDVDMPEMSGLIFADLTSVYSTLIFTTSFKRYAVEAYEKQIFDYLLKPITYERFAKSIMKVRKDYHAKGESAKGNPFFFYVKTELKGKLSKIEFNNIKFIEAEGNYVQIAQYSGKIMAYLSMSEIGEYLNVSSFSRIHKSFIVNHMAIETLEPGQVKLKDGSAIPIGRLYKDEFMKKMQHLILKSRRDV